MSREFRPCCDNCDHYECMGGLETCIIGKPIYPQWEKYGAHDVLCKEWRGEGKTASEIAESWDSKGGR